MRVAVTGATGFIGSSLGPLLELRGREVRGVGREVRVFEEALRGCDAVVHLANVAHTGADPKPTRVITGQFFRARISLVTTTVMQSSMGKPAVKEKLAWRST